MTDLRLPVPLHGTGAGLAAGQPDPHWQLVSTPVPTAPNPTAPGTTAAAPAPARRAGPDRPQPRLRQRHARRPLGLAHRPLRRRPDRRLRLPHHRRPDRLRRRLGHHRRLDGRRRRGGRRPRQRPVGRPARRRYRTQEDWFACRPVPLAGVPWRPGPNRVDVVVHNGGGVTPTPPAWCSAGRPPPVRWCSGDVALSYPIANHGGRVPLSPHARIILHRLVIFSTLSRRKSRKKNRPPDHLYTPPRIIIK